MTMQITVINILGVQKQYPQEFMADTPMKMHVKNQQLSNLILGDNYFTVAHRFISAKEKQMY